MNQTTPRCIQCGENPRMIIGYTEFAVNYHPLCNECHLILWEKSKRESRLTGTITVKIVPEKKPGLFESFICRSRYFALGLAACSLVQLPMMFLNGSFSGTVVHSVIIAIAIPWAASGFWLGREKP